jgi:hypothetical protein
VDCEQIDPAGRGSTRCRRGVPPVNSRTDDARTNRRRDGHDRRMECLVRASLQGSRLTPSDTAFRSPGFPLGSETTKEALPGLPSWLSHDERRLSPFTYR